MSPRACWLAGFAAVLLGWGAFSFGENAPAPEPNFVTLFADDFSAYPPAEILDRQTYGTRLGPWELMTLHYAWHSARFRGWQQVQLPFRILERDGRRFLDQPESFFNVVLKAGDPRWRNYTFEVELAVNDGPAGPVVRYQTSRQHYFICFEVGQPVKVYRRHQDDHVLLAMGDAARFKAEKDRLYRCEVQCDGSRLSVRVDGNLVVEVEDDAYSHGQIALRTEGCARFTAVRVLADPTEAERVASEKKRAAERLQRAIETIPRPRLLHTIPLPGKPSSVIGLHDVNDDGALEAIAFFPQEKEPFQGANRLCVFDWQGKPVWELEPWAPDPKWPASVAWLNVADLDGDGHTEVICTRGLEILILDGATGRIKRRAPNPPAYPGQGDPYERALLVDRGFVANLRGLPSPRDLLVKDEYRNLWAYTDDLRLLWHRSLNTGHFVAAKDLDGDGKDEVMGGYSMLRPDGTTLWTVPGGDPVYNRFAPPIWPPPTSPKPPLVTGSPPEVGSEHNDGFVIALLGPEPEAPLRIAIAASDLGFLLLDTEGRLLAHHRIGHAQRISVGRFRPDLPGRQIVVSTQWGNHRLLNLFDCHGNLLLAREIPHSTPWPVYWTGTDQPLLLFTGWAGGLWNRHFERLLVLPGALSVPPYACDVNQDGLDELLLLEENQIRIYGPDGVKATFRAPAASLTNWWSGGLYR